MPEFIASHRKKKGSVFIKIILEHICTNTHQGVKSM